MSKDESKSSLLNDIVIFLNKNERIKKYFIDIVKKADNKCKIDDTEKDIGIFIFFILNRIPVEAYLTSIEKAYADIVLNYNHEQIRICKNPLYIKKDILYMDTWVKGYTLLVEDIEKLSKDKYFQDKDGFEKHYLLTKEEAREIVKSLK